jgi:hypothetical protein
MEHACGGGGRVDFSESCGAGKTWHRSSMSNVDGVMMMWSPPVDTSSQSPGFRFWRSRISLGSVICYPRSGPHGKAPLERVCWDTRIGPQTLDVILNTVSLPLVSGLKAL